MNISQENIFIKSTVRIDNTTFIKCTFEDCILLYGGYGPTGFKNCIFKGEIKWGLVDSAEETLGFLQALNNGMGKMGKEVVKSWIEKITEENIVEDRPQSGS